MADGKSKEQRAKPINGKIAMLPGLRIDRERRVKDSTQVR